MQKDFTIPYIVGLKPIVKGKTLCIKIIIFACLFLSPIFSQSWNFHGEGIINPSYVWVLGDKNLFEAQNSFFPGLNYQLKGRFSLTQITDYFSISLNYSTGYTSTDQIFMNLKSKNLEGILSNNFQESLSYLTLWNKNINGMELRYIEKKYSLKGILAKIESTKKQKSFYGNDTSGPYILGDFYLVQGREKVYLNGKLLDRDVDYVIDYSYGILYFSYIITSEDLVIIEYEVRGIMLQVYNLLGLRLDYSPLSLSFLNVDDPSSHINRKFIDFSLSNKWGENYLEFTLSQGILDGILVGRGYNLSLNYKRKNFSINGRSLKVDENYPYFKEILGNFEINPGVFQNKLNFNFIPYSFLSYTLNFLREDTEVTTQSIQNALSIDLSEFSFLGLWNNDIKNGVKDMKKLVFNYKEIPSSFYIQETVDGEKREVIKNFSSIPQSSNVKVNINYQVKDTYTFETLLLTQTTTQFYIEIFSPNINFSLGELSQYNKNLNPDSPLETSQTFVTDGYQADFTLSYTPLSNTLKVYINGTLIENGGTFTYYVPSEEPITYTVEINLSDKTLQIFFIDESGKNPPPSGLTVLVKYKYLLPQESYYKKDDISLNLKWGKINLSSKGTIFEKDKNISKVLSFSIYGEIIPRMWMNFSFSQYFEENKKNLSLNISYRPLPWEFSQGYIYQETPTSLIKSFSFLGKMSTSFINLQGGYNFRESVYSNYLLIVENFNISGSFNLFNGKISLSYFTEKRESNQYIPNYLFSSYSLSYNKNFFGINLNYSLTRENYIDLSFKWKNIIEIFPFKNNKSKIFLENIYYQKNEKFYSSFRLGTQFSISW
ncbi:MAG: hypothetical protein ACPLKX_07660 [Dictyoglomaceae bacterium]